jgi:hypothetical protein
VLRPAFRIVFAVLLIFAAPTSVAASSPHEVDPASVSPPLNPAFDPWVCTATGGGPICRGTTSFSWKALDLGLSCAGRSIFTTGESTVSGTRWSTPDGRATRSSFHSEAIERWSLSPAADAPSLRVRARFNESFDYRIPGDLATRTYTLTGGYYQVTAAGAGLVWHDVGYARTDPGPDAPTVLHGPHDSSNGVLEQVLPAVCPILAP